MIRHAREEAAMTHGARRRSTSGFYHVVPKGRGDQVIFEDDDDRKLYRYLLADAKRNYGIRIHSYCLMSNHAHLVIEDDNALMSTFMKSVHEQYGSYFADKTGRAGGIFTRPYWSEPIETDAYLLDAVRYVHANPATAGICRASAYEWSSAKDYLGREGLADTEMVLSMLGGRDGFVAFSRQVSSFSENVTPHGGRRSDPSLTGSAGARVGLGCRRTSPASRALRPRRTASAFPSVRRTSPR